MVFVGKDTLLINFKQTSRDETKVDKSFLAVFKASTCELVH